MSKVTEGRKAKRYGIRTGKVFDWTNRRAGNVESVREKVRFSINLAEMFVFLKSH